MARGEIRKVDPRMLADFFAALVLTPVRGRQLFALNAQIDWALVNRYSRKAVDLFRDGCADRMA
jgi:hypothetical protein